jgi:SAM-dependent methyltransferase
MLNLGRIYSTYRSNFAPLDHSTDHRKAVGGLWDVIGPLQFKFMTERAGLKPEHCLLDIGCGSLRAGRLFIDYLDPGNYLGVDYDKQLVKDGIAKEIVPETLAAKHPSFAFNGNFVFAFDKKPDFAIAQSVFTHLTINQIQACLRNLKGFAPKCVFYATFLRSYIPLPAMSIDPRRTFFFTLGQMRKAARETGWQVEYIGDWGHRRGQQMLRFTTT